MIENKPLLPINSSEFEKSLDKISMAISNLPIDIKKINNPDICPPDFLPFLAWQYSVEYWDSDWPVKFKRNIVKSAIKIHQHKGTVGAMNDALGTLDYETKITQWFEKPINLEPYTFAIDVALKNQGIDTKTLKNIHALINMAKNERSHLAKLRLSLKITGKTPKFATAIKTQTIIKIFPKNYISPTLAVA